MMTRLIGTFASILCLSLFCFSAFAETDPQADSNNLDSVLSASSALPPPDYVEPASDAPTKDSDVIHTVNGHPVQSPEHAFEITSKLKTANQQEVQQGDESQPQAQSPAPYQSE